ncbi:MAG: cyanophycinase [Porticoccaceae bacterium]|jgi:cyanophycinase
MLELNMQPVFRTTTTAVVLLVISTFVSANEKTTGPEKGALVIVGGGDRDSAMFRHFVKLAGGKDAKLVVIPTASSVDPEFDYAGHRSAKYAREELAMTNVTVVHSHDRATADTADFVAPIREADAVWFTGGRQWRIADAYLGTLAETAIRNVLRRGGVIGGSSAGASIQGSFLVRGDTKGSRILIGDHQRGFGFIRNSAIDQHVIPRKRQAGLIEVLTDPDQRMDKTINREALLGIGIDEATAIVVRKNKFEVIGRKKGVVLIYDPTKWASSTPDSDKYLTLKPGAKYNLETRAVLD